MWLQLVSCDIPSCVELLEEVVLGPRQLSPTSSEGFFHLYHTLFWLLGTSNTHDAPCSLGGEEAEEEEMTSAKALGASLCAQ